MLSLDSILFTPPQQIAASLGWEHTSTEVIVPSQGKGRFVGGGVVLEDHVGVFIALSCLDMIALDISCRHINDASGKSGVPLYLEALQWYLLRYSDPRNEGLDDMEVRRMAETGATRRALFDRLVVTPYAHTPRVTVETSSLRSIRASNVGIPPDLMPTMLQPASDADFERIHNLAVRARGSDIPIPVISKPVFLTPYLSTHYTIAGIDVRTSLNDEDALYLPVVDVAAAYAGLAEAGFRGNSYVMGAAGIVAAAQLNHSLQTAGDEDSCLAVRVTKRFNRTHWSPEQMDMVIPQGCSINEELETLIRASFMEQHAECKVKVGAVNVACADHARGIFAGDPAIRCIARRVLQDVNENQGVFTENAANFLRQVGLRPHWKAHIISALRAGHHLDAARSLDSQFHDGVVWADDKNEIVLTSNGYAWANRGDSPTGPVTNFTFEPVRIIRYPEHGDRFVQCVFRYHSEEINLTVPETALSSGTKLEKFLVDDLEASRFSMRVLDTRRCNYLLYRIRTQLDRLPAAEGISFLGWNGVRSKFYGPNFQAMEGRVTIDPEAPWLPGVMGLTHYKKDTGATAQLLPDLPVSLCDLISQILAFIVRAAYHYPIHPVLIQNNRHTTRIIQLLFRGLGQVTPVQVGRAGRTRMPEGLRAYPHYAVGADHDQVRSMKEPTFLLCDRGFRLDPSITDDQAKDAANSLQFLLMQMLKRLLQDDSEPLLVEPARRVLYESALVAEGNTIIRNISDLFQWPQAEPGYPVLEKILGSVSASEVQDHFEYDLKAQRVYMHAALIPKGRKEDLLSELSTLVRELDHDKVRIGIDAVSAMRFLNNYYGGKVNLTPIVDSSLFAKDG
jgi:hypothetical protein